MRAVKSSIKVATFLSWESQFRNSDVNSVTTMRQYKNVCNKLLYQSTANPASLVSSSHVFTVGLVVNKILVKFVCGAAVWRLRVCFIYCMTCDLIEGEQRPL